MITVGIITHPPRVQNGMLRRAMNSVFDQIMMPAAITVRVDANAVGAPIMRQRLLEEVRTPWLAWLDSDDEFLPHHLSTLMDTALAVDADMVYSWYDVVGGSDPRPAEEKLPWDPTTPRQTSIVTLVKTDLAREVGGYLVDGDLRDPKRQYSAEDWVFTKRMNDAGAKIHHVLTRTWLWHHHGKNTSGLPTRW